MLLHTHKTDWLSRQVDAGEARLKVTSLGKSYDGRGKVLDDVSFCAMQGEAVALIGGNGSGKSTLLRCCLRLVEPDRGDIRLLGEPLSALNGACLRRLRARVGLVFQRHNLVPQLSVLTNVIHGAMGRTRGMKTWLQAIAPSALRAEAMNCLEKVGLAHLAASRADQLSGGESQRVAIARALMQHPRLMMADEPVASLDPKVGREVMELFVDLIRKERITLIFVSHDLEHARRYSGKLLGLRRGKLVIHGNSDDFNKSDLDAIYH